MIFARKRRREIMEKFPYYSFSQVTRMMGKEWSDMDIDLKVSIIVFISLIGCAIHYLLSFGVRRTTTREQMRINSDLGTN